MRAALLLVLALTACDRTPRDASVALDAAGCLPDSGTLGFGTACTSACVCSSGVCYTFGDGTQACTLACTADTQCPSGSMGQKCNRQGYCRP